MGCWTEQPSSFRPPCCRAFWDTFTCPDEVQQCNFWCSGRTWTHGSTGNSSNWQTPHTTNPLELDNLWIHWLRGVYASAFLWLRGSVLFQRYFTVIHTSFTRWCNAISRRRTVFERCSHVMFTLFPGGTRCWNVTYPSCRRHLWAPFVEKASRT